MPERLPGFAGKDVMKDGFEGTIVRDKIMYWMRSCIDAGCLHVDKSCVESNYPRTIIMCLTGNYDTIDWVAREPYTTSAVSLLHT